MKNMNAGDIMAAVILVCALLAAVFSYLEGK